MAHPEQNLDPVATFGPEHHHHPGLRRKTQLGMRHGCQPVMPFAKICRLGRDHDPDGLIWEDHSAFLKAAAKAAARFGQHSGDTGKTAPQISTLITPVSADAAATNGSITSGTNAGAASSTTSSPLRA